MDSPGSDHRHHRGRSGSLAAIAASPAAPSHSPGWRYATATVLACAGAAALLIDLPVAQWFKTSRLPRELARILDFSEVFAHGTGAAILLLVALILDRSLAWPSLRWPAIRGPSYQPRGPQRNFARMIGAAFAGGLMVDCIKAVVERVRPRAADLVLQASALATFGDGSLASPSGSHSDLNSFPSGHAAVAAGMAAALGWKYPRGMLLFAALATCAAAQRVVTSAHFPSDVAVGAAIGLIGASLFLGRRPPEPGLEPKSGREDGERSGGMPAA